MKRQNMLSALYTTVHCLLTSTSNAVPVSGQGTWATTLQPRDFDGNTSTIEAYYDTNLNMTWLKDANYAHTTGYGDAYGAMNWAAANSWATGLSINGITGWRLPTVMDPGLPGCDLAYSFSDSDCGYNVDTSTGEMAHMFYTTLGDKAYYDPLGVPQSSYGLTNTGPFSNLESSLYWSATQDASDTGSAWAFFFQDGFQGTPYKSVEFYAWIVHSGDVGVPIPSPDTDGDGTPDSADNCPSVANTDQKDTDVDGVGDACDNCTNVNNTNQRDTDGDGYGNACDADLDNSGFVNFADLALFKSAFGTSDPHADFDGSGGIVNFGDLAVFKQLFGKAPGPSYAFVAENELGLDGIDDVAIREIAVNPPTSSLDASTFTIEAWVYPTSDSGMMNIVTDSAYYLMLTPQPFRLEFAVMTSTGFPAWLSFSGNANPLTRDQWNHVVGMVDNATRRLEVAVNGELSGPLTMGGTVDVSFPQTFSVGNSYPDVLGNFPFVGRIDEVRLSSTILYTANFTPSSSLGRDDSTLGLWHFNEAEGAATFADSSGNSNVLSGLNGATTVGGSRINIGPTSAELPNTIITSR